MARANPTEKAEKAEATEAPAAPPVPRVPKPARFRVWPHGDLHCDGMVFKAGEELPLTETDIERLGCGEAVERIPED